MITLYSFLLSVFWSSVLTLLLFLCRRSTGFIERFGIHTLLGLYAVCVIRFSLPFEFHFTKIVETPELYNPIHSMLYRHSVAGARVYQILLLLWLAVSAALFLRFVLKYVRFLSVARRIPQYRTKQIAQVKHSIISEADRQKVRIIPIDQYAIPKTAGFFKATILLPQRQYKSKELALILLHEYTHFQHHDSFIKLTSVLMCIIFWWNPAVYLLKSELNAILEMRCDRFVCEKFSQSKVRYYLKTILNYASQATLSRRSFFHCSLSGDFQMKQRFVALLRYRRRGYRKKVLVMCISLVAFLFMLSYLFVFQSAYPPEQDRHACFHEADFSLIKNRDATYSVMVGDNAYTVPADYLNQFEKKG